MITTAVGYRYPSLFSKINASTPKKPCACIRGMVLKGTYPLKGVGLITSGGGV
jgi:hypothetical protein